MFLARLNPKLLIVTFILLLFGCGNDSSIKLCTDSLISDMTSTKITDNKEVKELWSNLKEKRYISQSGSDDQVRPKFVTMQFLFESILSSMIKEKQLRNVISVIYTPNPSTPLRTDGSNISALLSKDAAADPERINSLSMRFESIHEYLSNNGKLYTIYKDPKDENKIPGFSIYKSNLSKYPNNLIDVPVDNFNPKHTGASYLVECESGEILLFALSGRQLDNTVDGEWELYYGRIDEPAISGHYRSLKNLYKKYGVNFGFDS